ncbi:CheY-like chemotaxis protein [Ancylomarina subtilis]|uniref:CheY-like chemotaxis protein n=1 Tax=Ancylomarina subtilis TaxID=1639035 RepID=A0A4Q7VAK5_9BACT|nr:response regulator [Ancylomarina subtilis]RZT91772.1 CheY-like chemotaxis protein [Ancylomarina subtilis]
MVEKASCKILLVEDDFINGKIVKTLLEKANYNVEWVKNGKEALEILIPNSGDYGLVLMDIQMPIINGYEVSLNLREIGIKIPIICMTANAYSDENRKSKEAGMNDYISKPVTKTVLFEMLDKYL